jgi:pimeloyl-ACP methyl ester carboxylesterase
MLDSPRVPPIRGPLASIPRWRRGLHSLTALFLMPLGKIATRPIDFCSNPERRRRGLTLVLPGIDGESAVSHSIVAGLLDAGVSGAIEILDWTTGCYLLGIAHLRSRERHRRQARRVADRIRAFRAEYPDLPLNVIGHSAGCGIAVWALELLAQTGPPRAAVDRLVLLASALSPGYDLRPALEQVSDRAWSFHSRRDLFFDVLGTVVFGTVDGRWGPAAGWCGVTGPASVHPKLTQIGWTPRDVVAFHLGGHFGATNRVFVAERIAPRLLSTDYG